MRRTPEQVPRARRRRQRGPAAERRPGRDRRLPARGSRCAGIVHVRHRPAILSSPPDLPAASSHRVIAPRTSPCRNPRSSAGTNAPFRRAGGVSTASQRESWP